MYKVFICFIIMCLGIGFTGCNVIPITDGDVVPGRNTESTGAAVKRNQLKKQDKTDGEEILNEEIDPIEKRLKMMTLDQKIGQLFIIDVQSDALGSAVTVLSEEVKNKIMRNHVGGIILFKQNIVEKEQVKKLIKDMQDAAEIPLFIGVDEEGGMVSRVGQNKTIVEKPFKPAFALGQEGDLKAAYEEAARMGKVLSDLGFNLNFAPVADIYNNEANTVIGKRSFGTTKEQVIPMVISYAKGLLSQEVQPVLKHFPGHGNTLEDSHQGLAYINKTKEALEEEELVPFVEGVNRGIDMIMKGHLIVKDIDKDYPATLSKKWADYIEKLFEGRDVLFITDAMNMGAIVNHYQEEEAIVMSFMAGNDLLLMPKDIDKAFRAVKTAYEEGRITDERLHQSVRKILSKKVERNILVLE